MWDNTFTEICHCNFLMSRFSADDRTVRNDSKHLLPCLVGFVYCTGSFSMKRGISVIASSRVPVDILMLYRKELVSFSLWS